MPNKINTLKRLGLAISYAALLSASNSFALDEETRRAQLDQFDIFDVKTKDLEAPILIAQNEEGDAGKVAFPDFSQFDDSDDDEFEDDLFVDAVDENGDIPTTKKVEKATKKEDSKQSSDSATNAPTTEESVAKKTDEETNKTNLEPEGLPIMEDMEEEASEDATIDPLEALLLESDTPVIDEIGTIEDVPEIDLDSEPKEEKVPNSDDIGFVFENDGNDDDIEIPEEEEFKRLLIEGIDSEEDSKSGSDASDDPLDNLLSGDGSDETSSAPAYPDTNANSSVSNDKSPEVSGKYRDLKKHLANFLLSFAGEEELSKSNTSNIHDMNFDEDDVSTPNSNDSSDTDSDKDDILDNNLSSPDESLDAILDLDIEIEKEDKADEERKKRLAEANKIREQKLREEQEKKKKQKQKIVMGSCAELPDKISKCSPYRCTMPNTTDRKSESVISIKKNTKDKTGNACNYSMKTEGQPTIDCKLDDGDVSVLSILTQNYFDEAGNKNLDMKSEFPKKCKTTKVANKGASKTAEAKKAVQKKKVKKELTKEEKAYFDMLDKKREALPEHKQLSKSVRDTIKKVAPSLSEEKKKSVKKNAKPKKLNIAHGDTGPEPSEDGGTKISNTGMDISLSTTTSEQSEIRTMMEKAYRALLSGQTSAAVVLYKNVLELDSKNMDALFGLATAYHRNFQYEQARSIYAQILSIEPDNKEVLNNFLVLVAEESPESALIELQKLERINSSFSPIPAQIAMIYLKIGQPETAERYLRRAVILSPDNITYKYNLAITSDKLHKYYQAINLYKQVLDAAKRGAIIPGSTHAIAERMDYLEGKLSSMN